MYVGVRRDGVGPIKEGGESLNDDGQLGLTHLRVNPDKATSLRVALAPQSTMHLCFLHLFLFFLVYLIGELKGKLLLHPHTFS